MIPGYASRETDILETFLTPDPWNKGQSTQFSVVAKYKGGLMPAYAAADKRSRIDGYYLYSSIDQQYRPLPDALVKLWLDRKVPTHRMPVLLFGMAGMPESKDYAPHLALNATQRASRTVGVIFLGIIVGVLGWLLFNEGVQWGPVLSLAGILFAVWFLVRQQRMTARRKSLTQWILSQLSVAHK